MRAFIWLQRQTRCCVKTRQCNGYAMTCTSGFMSSKYMLQCRWIYKTNHSTLSSILANNFSRYLGAYSKRASSSDSGTEERISAVDVNQFTTRWDAMFQQLKEYKSRHGDLLVPARYPENPSLGHFVDNNRQAYRMRQEYERHCADGDEKNPNSKWRKFIMMMTDEKIEALESIGFVWNVLDHTWNTRYEELLEYIKVNGNALVPQEHESLGLWVHKQRRNYKIYKQQIEGKANSHTDTSLSPERVEKLNKVGFVWDVHEALWLERFEDLKKYRRDHGDTCVHRECWALYKWVEKQRADYKNYNLKKMLDEDESLQQSLDNEKIEAIRSYHSGMNEERIHLLESEDFIWDPKEFAWQMKYDELLEWIALNGHGAIKRGKKNYTPLEGWAENQRRLYRKHLNGEKTTLTQERIDKLSRAGFVFLIEKGRRTKAIPTATKKKQTVATS